MIGADIEDFPIIIGKGEAVQEFENKVERIYDLLEKVQQIQEVFTEVENKNCCR